MSNKAKIRCVTYGGRIGWFLRTHFSACTSFAYLEFQYFIRKKTYKQYIKLFNECMNNQNPLLPCLISIETINRCNSKCAFCPANIEADSRPFAKMEEGLFKKIIDELSELEYKGYLNLYVNNEPFMDRRIEEWYIYASQKLPKAKMLLYTNGTLVSEERFKTIIPVIDKMIINNYSDDLKLHRNVADIIHLVEKSPEYWEKDITVQIRYINEILSNRAGSSPNNTRKRKNGKICIMPYTDFTIYPDGRVGLCCNDALERTCYGNVSSESIYDIWTSNVYNSLRRVIGSNRDKYSFCEGCDFVDAGIRNDFINEKLAKIKKK